MRGQEKPADTRARPGKGCTSCKPQFAQHDFDVVLTSEDDELAEQVRSGSAAVEQVRADLARPEGMEELVAHVAATAPRARRSPSTRGPASTANSQATPGSTTS
ncbi:hypothetical protein [Amycolatopsis sp. NPDC051372]|uniref:hypothetical protein n=1 Tax=unclassified Amycolatopsis TaxID=2618356 RepID=UPI00341AA0D2